MGRVSAIFGSAGIACGGSRVSFEYVLNLHGEAMKLMQDAILITTVNMGMVKL